MQKKVWFSRRAIRLHAVILVVVPAFMALCVWQITRALNGNSLSWAYVFEWPLFAGYAIYMWWRLVHEGAVGTSNAATIATVPSEPASHPSEEVMTPATPPAPAPLEPSRQKPSRQEEEDAELAAYNAYLAQLAERDRAAGR